MNKKNNKNFEQSLKRLEEISELLEDENTPLEDSIKLFEEGIELKDFCEEKLKSAKLKIDKIIKKTNLEITDARVILDDLRVIKSDEEIKIMHEAGILASNAHVEGIMKTYSGIGEWEIQSIIEAHFSTNQSCPSYSSIVGGGDNATILHYNSNNMKINDGDFARLYD